MGIFFPRPPSRSGVIPMKPGMPPFDGLVKSEKSSFFVTSRHGFVSGGRSFQHLLDSPTKNLSGNDSWFPSGNGLFAQSLCQIAVLLVRRTPVRLRASPCFLCTASGAQSPLLCSGSPVSLILNKNPHFQSGNFAVPIRYFRMGTNENL
jgi:hypothetical protein